MYLQELNNSFDYINNKKVQPHGLRICLLRTVEAIRIHFHKPNLCTTKKFVQSLQLIHQYGGAL